MAEEKIEVFQDLYLHEIASNRTALRTALIEVASAPWRHGAEQEKRLMSCIDPNEDIIVFEREESEDIDAVELSLWSNNGGYKVTNIVPRKLSSLGEHRYNLALQDFVVRVVNPATEIANFDVKESLSRQGLDDWLTPDAATLLRRFSSAANKSTRSRHPSDRSRWLEFLVAVHQANSSMDTEFLIRWLIEVESWHEDIARELGSEYAFASDLFLQYNTTVALRQEQCKVQHQSRDWFEPFADEALRLFSGAANKATGSSHPADWQRWLKFLVAVHRTRVSIVPEKLSKWLIEDEQWPEESAQKLGFQYEFALDVLRQYEPESV